jgi:hypothetical protein
VSLDVGESVLLRSIFRSKVRWCFPHRYAGEWDGRLGIYCQPGNRGKVMRRGNDGYLVRWVDGDPPRDHAWRDAHVLRFMRPGAAHTVEVWWDLSWSSLGWYVNLQAPLAVHGSRFDTTDWALDIVVEPDGSWRWKDEDEYTQAIELGVFPSDEAAGRVRSEGEQVIAERPWPTGWESWRPPRDWAPLDLPRDWHVV